MKGKELASTGPLGLFGRTRDGVLVLVSSFERGRRSREIEWKVYNLEQAYSELKAGYAASQSRIKELESEVEELWRVVSKVPELRKRLENIYIKLDRMKKNIPHA